jgi:hypothetical protein
MQAQHLICDLSAFGLDQFRPYSRVATSSAAWVNKLDLPMKEQMHCMLTETPHIFSSESHRASSSDQIVANAF